MVFDYFKQRASEGIKQVENLAGKAATGKLVEGLSDTAKYVKVRQSADAESIAKFTMGLKKSREKFLGDLSKALGKGTSLDDTLNRLEEVLLTSDIGATTTMQIISDLREISTGAENKLEPDDVNCVLRGTLVQVLGGGLGAVTGVTDSSETVTAETVSDNGSISSVNPSAITFAPIGSSQPSVLFIMGANGMGKTTTIGKIANRLREQSGQKVLLVAADTFRAAAVEQLVEWSTRASVDIVVPLDADERPESVASRACEKALAEQYDVVIVDTSGRLSNNRKLNEELRAMKRSIDEKIPGAPHDTLLVVDASVGRNAVDQARTWKEQVGISGLIVTKLDGTARAGFVVSIARDLEVPVKLIGVGEGLSDLRDFDPELFVDSLLGYTAEQAEALRGRYASNSVLQEKFKSMMSKKAAPPKEDRYLASMQAPEPISRKAKRKAAAKEKNAANKKKGK